ncbi:MAG: PDZ domain-containing protein [Fimbriimonadales bacterium]|nr:PDZ domain-containing protein [Fimbriimonadales bacterium]
MCFSLILTILLPGLFAQPIDQETKDAVLKAVGRVIKERAYARGVNFAKWDELAQEYEERFQKAQTHDEFANEVNRAFAQFGLSHLRLLTPHAARVQKTGQGVGLGIQARAEEGGVRVVLVLPGSPAEKAGLQPGDLITHADGKPITEPERLRGEKGTQVRLTVKRMDGTLLELTVVRGEFSTLRKDTLTWIDEKTALLRVHSFAVGYDRELIDQYFEKIAKAEKLILDLRGNGGGQTLNLFHLAGKLFPGGTRLGKFVSRDHAREYLKKHPEGTDDPVEVAKEFGLSLSAFGRGEPPFKGDLVVLVDSGTGSASEILAQTVQELQRGKVVGTKTAGAVLASTLVNLPADFALQVPLMEYVSPKGQRLEMTGVTPDVLVDKDVIAQDDVLLKIALKAFSTPGLKAA